MRSLQRKLADSKPGGTLTPFSQGINGTKAWERFWKRVQFAMSVLQLRITSFKDSKQTFFIWRNIFILATSWKRSREIPKAKDVSTQHLQALTKLLSSELIFKFYIAVFDGFVEVVSEVVQREQGIKKKYLQRMLANQCTRWTQKPWYSVVLADRTDASE